MTVNNKPLNDLNILIPRIGRKIQATWGTVECRQYMVTLLTDSRNGQRRGFDPLVAKIIYQIYEDHDAAFPQFDDSNILEPEFGGARQVVSDMEQRGYAVQRAESSVLLKLAAYGIIVFLGIGAVKFIVQHDVINVVASMFQ